MLVRVATTVFPGTGTGPLPPATGQPLPPAPGLIAGADVVPSRHRPRFVGVVARWGRGRPDDPAWVRPALLAVLALTAVLYLWDLGASGWANSFYAAAVQASTKSWKAFFFGSFDSSNFITVDKPPASLWVMDISARVFGLSSWSLLVPQALEGVAAVGVLYVTVRRWSSASAGIIAAAVMALTPVAALMFRYDNPDALLVLLLCIAAYLTTVATEKASMKWLVSAFAVIGLAFLTKMLQAYLVVPAMVGTYLLAAPTGFWRRTGHLAAGGVSMVVSSLWWVVIVMAVPAADRPYIGSSQDNSLWNLIFGYNGFGRLSGNENGSVAAGAPGSANRWGITGLTRLFGSEMGSQISWVLPAALVLLVVVLALTLRRRRTDLVRASMVLWGGWLLVTGVVFSLGAGIIHPYYNVALAPAIGAVVGVGAWSLWARRRRLWARAAMALVIALSAWWSYELLRRVADWHPDLRLAVLGAGAAAIFGLAVWPYVGRNVLAGVSRALVVAVIALAVLLGPASYTLATAATPHSGAIPTAGPTAAGGFGGGGGFGRTGGFGGGFGGAGGFGGGPAAGGSSTNTGGGTGFPGGRGFPGGGSFAGRSAAGGSSGRGFPGGRSSSGSGATGGFPGGFGGGAGGFGGRGGFGGGGGGLLNASTPSAAITDALKKDAAEYSWVAAVVGADNASGYQLASGEPVMAIGGFNGTDPAPTLAQFEKYVSEHKIHYFIASGGFGFGFGGGGGGGGGDDASQITSWVEAHFTAATVGGVSVYNLAQGTK